MTQLLQSLQNILKKNKITMYALSEAAGIERSLLSKLLNGKRGLTPEYFSKIINAISLPAETETRLRKLYIAESFGKENFFGYINFVKGLAEASRTSPGDSRKTHTVLQLNGDTISFNSKREFYNILEAVIESEITLNTGNERIYTNLFSEDFYEICRPLLTKAGTDFRQLIEIKSHRPTHTSLIAQVLRFALLGYRTAYYNTEADINEHTGVLYSKYLITGEYTVLADSSATKGCLIRSKTVADSAAELFLAADAKASPYLVLYNDILDSKNDHLKMFSSPSDKFIAVEDTFCSVMAMTHDMWNQIAKPDIPNRDYLVTSTYEYYRAFAASLKSKMFISTKPGIRNFVQNGIVEQMPREYAYPLTIENRIKVLEAFRKIITQPENDFYLLKEPYSEYLSNFCLEIFDKSQETNSKDLLIGFSTPNADHHYIGNLAFRISDSVTIGDMQSFLSHLAVSDFCYTPKESLAFIDDEIEKCRFMLAEQA